MKIGASTVGAVFLAAALCLGVPSAWAKTDYHSGIWDLLRKNHFYFAENGDSRTWLAGSILAGGKHYQIWGYAWEETAQTKAVSTEHASHSVLVFEETGKEILYVGAYGVDGVPFHVRGRTIKFDYGNGHAGTSFPPSGRGDKIVFDERGPPPRVLLSGEFHTFNDAVHDRGLWRILRKAGFPGLTDIDARMWPGGSISVGGRRFEIWRYEWKPYFKTDESLRPSSYKALVFERMTAGLVYLGAYTTDGAPFHVEGRAVKFRYRKDNRPLGVVAAEPGNEIVFDGKGPPARVQIGWALREFERAK